MKLSNYDKIFNVLCEWYTPKQIDQIWDLLKQFDKANYNVTSSKRQAASNKLLDNVSRII